MASLEGDPVSQGHRSVKNTLGNVKVAIKVSSLYFNGVKMMFYFDFWPPPPLDSGKPGILRTTQENSGKPGILRKT